MNTKVTDGQALQQSLPREAYLSASFFEQEREAIFFGEWYCALREEELRAPGSHKVLELLGQSVLVVRTRDGALRAHYNVCPHRGARLCGEGRKALPGPSGVLSNGTIRCPYHAWTFSLEGRLLSAPHLSETPKEVALHPIGVATWGGFVFLHLTPGRMREGLLAQLGPGRERVGRYPLRELVTAQRLAYEVAANWKVVAENYNECYHCGPVHPELCDVVPAFRSKGGAGLDWERGVPHRDGAFTFTLSGTTSRAPMPGLSEEEKVLHKGEIFYPNLFLSLSADHVAAFRLEPLACERTRIVCEFLFHPEEAARPGFDPSDAVAFWDIVNRQDWAICEEVQRGMNTRVWRHGYYAPMEDPSLDIRRYVEARLELEAS